jgi:hypothetical protein
MLLAAFWACTNALDASNTRISVRIFFMISEFVVECIKPVGDGQFNSTI